VIRRIGLLALVSTLTLAPAGPAAASPVLRASGGELDRAEDPFLPSRAASDLPGLEPARAPRRPLASAAARGGPTVARVLREELLAGRLMREEHDSYREAYSEARVAVGRLPGRRKVELGAVVNSVEVLAAARRLSPDRMGPVFLTLRRNAELWRFRLLPAPGARLTFGRSPVVFQYYAGRGVQVQPLANFGRANALVTACLGQDTRPVTACRREALRALLDELSALAVDRAGWAAWEHYFGWGGGRPPWVSGISQGTAIQALTRGSALLGEPAYLELARSALGGLETAAPLGVRVPAEGGDHFLLYSFDSGLRVLNGHLQALIGLHDFAQATQDPRALALFASGEAAARVAVPRHDTGAWSLYAWPGRESDLGYHRLVRNFLRRLCERTAQPVYCATAERFTAYLEEEPRLEYLGTRRARARAPVVLRFRLSKRSRVSVGVTRRGRLLFARRRTFQPYGRGSFTWTPARPGRYRVRLEAADLRNHYVVRHGTVRVGRARRR
jgi:hypothetical protein